MTGPGGLKQRDRTNLDQVRQARDGHAPEDGAIDGPVALGRLLLRRKAVDAAVGETVRVRVDVSKRAPARLPRSLHYPSVLGLAARG
jgi:hypothetical protein